MDNPKETINQSPKPRTSKLAKASFIMALLGLVVCILLPILVLPTIIASKLAITSFLMGLLSLVTCVFWPILALLSIICGVTALVKIRNSNDMLKGKNYAIIGFVLPIIVFLIILILLPLIGRVRKVPSKLVCGTKLKGLATCFLLYAHDFDGLLPPANQWCDLLINETDIYPDTLICPDADAIVGESTYAMNIEAVGKKLEQLPPDMVLLFETDMGKEGTRNTPISDRPFYAFLKKYDPDWLVRYKDSKVYPNRWNLSGGPEMLSAQSHKGKGCNVLFADGHSSWVPAAEIPNLRWTTDKPSKE